MSYKALAAAAFAAVAFSAPAHAANWGEIVDICAAAAETEGVVTAGAYRAKFLNGSGASTKTVSVKLIPENGEPVTATCKIRRGEVTDFTVKA